TAAEKRPLGVVEENDLRGGRDLREGARDGILPALAAGDDGNRDVPARRLDLARESGGPVLLQPCRRDSDDDLVHLRAGGKRVEAQRNHRLALANVQEL